MKQLKHQGFSLIEMVVALAVIGILMASIMPSVSEWMTNSKVRMAADSIQSGLQAARGEAVKRNRSITLWLVTLSDNKVMDDSCKVSATGASWVVSVNSPDGKCSAAASTTTDPMVVQSHPSGEGSAGVTASATAADGSTAASSVTFNGFGQVTGASQIGKIDVTAPNATRSLRLIVSTSGSVLMCDPHVSDAADPRHCTN